MFLDGGELPISHKELQIIARLNIQFIAMLYRQCNLPF